VRSSLTETIVIARFMRANHFVLAVSSKLGRPDKPGDDGFGVEGYFYGFGTKVADKSR
jgi:hypothetical protein